MKAIINELLENHSSLREMARMFCMSKASVHNAIKRELQCCDEETRRKIQAVLDENKRTMSAKGYKKGFGKKHAKCKENFDKLQAEWSEQKG